MTFPAPTHDTTAAQVARMLRPTFGWCGRCGMPWSMVESHITEYGGGHGCFPLCEECWILLGCAEARIEYYGALMDAWDADEETRSLVGKAVANE